MTKNIYAALAAAQEIMTAAMKDSENPHFRSKYADLGAVQAACLPALRANGFAVFQPFQSDEAGYWIETILAHESGEVLSCRIPLILGKHDMQGLGSAITYARRYGLFCMSGVAPEDDDGNKAAEQGQKEPVRRATSKREDERWAPLDDGFEKAVNAEIAKITNITDLDELASYWSVLNKAHPSVAADVRVIAAKDYRKAAIIAKMKEAAK